jgi:hypothetical protein
MKHAIVLLLFSLIGCVPLEDTSRDDPSPPSPANESPIIRAAKAAFAIRDNVLAEEFESIAGDVESGDLKFDAKLKARIDEARQKASEASNAPLANVIAAEFGANAMQNPQKVAKALKELAKALR